MSRTLLVVDRPEEWPLHGAGVERVRAADYLTKEEYSALRHARVFNLCRSYRYQSTGYYVSLLAGARGHHPLPTAFTMQDFRQPFLVRFISSELQALIERSLARLQSDRFTLSIYFARNMAAQYERLCRALFNLFPAPLLRAQFRHDGHAWMLRSLAPFAARDIPSSHWDFVLESVQRFFQRPGRSSERPRSRYSLALLLHGADPTPPSDARALRRFERAAAARGIAVERIGPEDYGRIPTFDALFIRATTRVTDFTYRFARRAEAEGLAVIDDPLSILRCTNKVFLTELLARRRIRAPRSRIVHRDRGGDPPESLGFPCVLKEPDSSFSLGVKKARDRAEYRAHLAAMFERSDLVLVQEYLPTAFDWRIGVLDNQPLYACKYFMARDHWQIYRNTGGRTAAGLAQAVALEEVPARVVRCAVEAAAAVGEGFYGVDLKQCGRAVYVIEVNDNPSLDAGIEDGVLGMALYDQVCAAFERRLEPRRGEGSP